jgi:hypothetical protein
MNVRYAQLDAAPEARLVHLLLRASSFVFVQPNDDVLSLIWPRQFETSSNPVLLGWVLFPVEAQLEKPPGEVWCGVILCACFINSWTGPSDELVKRNSEGVGNLNQNSHRRLAFVAQPTSNVGLSYANGVGGLFLIPAVAGHQGPQVFRKIAHTQTCDFAVDLKCNKAYLYSRVIVSANHRGFKTKVPSRLCRRDDKPTGDVVLAGREGT